MKVVIYQTNPILMNVKANLEDVISKIHEGCKEGNQLIVFPELALTGYFVDQNYHKVALRLDSNEIKHLALATKGTAAVVGFIEESPSMNFYNSALVIVDGEIQFAYRKLNLPNYGVFEERKYFASGKHIPVFKLNDLNIAVYICNDLWHPSLPYLGVCQKADIFVTIFNSSQGSMGTEFSNIESWKIINSFYSRIFGIYNICANRVGEECRENRRHIICGKQEQSAFIEESIHDQSANIYRFWGGSEIINPFGQQIAKAVLYKEDKITAEISRDLLRQKRILLPYLREDDAYFTYRELNRILYND
ncbi:MAG: nitrilase-related carbon-nitrogen hydrolase [Spirochaetota bacterium]|nr:nitrilase-related carbon-nitrogen hydrolase [Spirochaetota bacterium]